MSPAQGRAIIAENKSKPREQVELERRQRQFNDAVSRGDRQAAERESSALIALLSAQKSRTKDAVQQAAIAEQITAIKQQARAVKPAPKAAPAPAAPMFGTISEDPEYIAQQQRANEREANQRWEQRADAASNRSMSEQERRENVSPIALIRRELGTINPGALLGEGKHLREGGIHGLLSKKAKATVNDARELLRDSGYRMPDGRSFDDAFDDEVLTFLEEHGTTARPESMADFNTDEQLAEEEEAYYRQKEIEETQATGVESRNGQQASREAEARSQEGNQTIRANADLDRGRFAGSATEPSGDRRAPDQSASQSDAAPTVQSEVVGRPAPTDAELEEMARRDPAVERDLLRQQALVQERAQIHTKAQAKQKAATGKEAGEFGKLKSLAYKELPDLESAEVRDGKIVYTRSLPGVIYRPAWKEVLDLPPDAKEQDVFNAIAQDLAGQPMASLMSPKDWLEVSDQFGPVKYGDLRRQIDNMVAHFGDFQTRIKKFAASEEVETAVRQLETLPPHGNAAKEARAELLKHLEKVGINEQASPSNLTDHWLQNYVAARVEHRRARASAEQSAGADVQAAPGEVSATEQGDNGQQSPPGQPQSDESRAVRAGGTERQEPQPEPVHAEQNQQQVERTIAHQRADLDGAKVIADTGKHLVVEKADGTQTLVKSDSAHLKPPREFSSTQVDITGDLAKKLLAFGKKIPDKELAEDGREDKPHITVKFGLHDDAPDAVRELLASEKPVTAKLGKVSIFPAREGSDFDVVKVDVESPDLHRLNERIAEARPVTDTHPTYKPHVTIAYVKPGEGKKYVGDATFEGQEVSFDSVTFSSKNREKIAMPLGGRVAAGKPQIGAFRPIEDRYLQLPNAARKHPALWNAKYSDEANRKATAQFTGKDGRTYFIVRRMNEDTFTVYDDNLKKVAVAVFDTTASKDYFTGYKSKQSIVVEPEYRRKGIATAITDFAERQYGKPYKPTNILSPEMKAFTEDRARQAGVLYRRDEEDWFDREVEPEEDADVTAEDIGFKVRRDMLWINEPARQAIEGVLRAVQNRGPKGWTGATVDRISARNLAALLQLTARQGGFNPLAVARLEALAGAIEEIAKRGPVAFVVPSKATGVARATKRQEEFHQWQLRTGQGRVALAAPDWFARQPQAARILSKLGAHYDTVELQKPGVAESETAAHIAGGEWARVGLTFEEAVEWLDGYFSQIVQRYGADALESLTPMHPQVQREFEKVKDLYGSGNPRSRTNARTGSENPGEHAEGELFRQEYSPNGRTAPDLRAGDQAARTSRGAAELAPATPGNQTAGRASVATASSHPTRRSQSQESGFLNFSAFGFGQRKSPSAPIPPIPVPANFNFQQWGREVMVIIQKARQENKITQAQMTELINQATNAMNAFTANDGAKLAEARRAVKELLKQKRWLWLGDPFRVLMLAGDLLVLRQGFKGLTWHPALWGRAVARAGEVFTAMARDGAFTESGYNRGLAKIMTNAWQKVADEAGLDWGGLSELQLDRNILSNEEGAIQSWVQKVPVLKQIEAYNKLFLDILRMEVFAHEAENLKQRGVAVYKTVGKKQVVTDDYKQLAKVINIITGRASLPEKLKTAVDGSSFLLTAPRWAISNFQFINPAAFATTYRKSPQVAMKQLRGQIQYLGTTSGLAMLAMAAVAAGVADGFEWEDPDSPEWGQVRFGNRRFSVIQGGARPYARFAAQMVKRAIWMATAEDGKELVMEKEKGVDQLTRFGRTRLTPGVSLGVDQGLMRAEVDEFGRAVDARQATGTRPIRGFDAVGAPKTVSESLLDRIVPLTYHNVLKTVGEEVAKRDNAAEMIGAGALEVALNAPEFLGADANKYAKRTVDVEGVPFARKKWQPGGYGDMRDLFMDKGYESDEALQSRADERRPLVDAVLKGLAGVSGAARAELLREALDEKSIERAGKLKLNSVTNEARIEAQKLADWKTIENDPRYLAMTDEQKADMKRRFSAGYAKYKSRLSSKNDKEMKSAKPIPESARQRALKQAQKAMAQ